MNHQWKISDSFLKRDLGDVQKRGDTENVEEDSFRFALL